jgi:Uma2 family endonuclease
MILAIEQGLEPVRVRMDRPLTDEELQRFCSANEPARVERDANGDLIIMSPDFPAGNAIEGEVYGELLFWAREDGRGKVFSATAGFTLPDGSMRAADAAWVDRRRWDALNANQLDSYTALTPEFVIEVRSKSERLAKLRERMEIWIANGAELAWLIDPERRVVEVYRVGDETEVHENPSSVQGTGPVRGFELVMARVWG